MNSPRISPEKLAELLRADPAFLSMMNPETLKRPEYRAVVEKVLKNGGDSRPTPSSSISAIIKEGITGHQRRLLIIGAVSIALLGLIFIDHYNPVLGILYNVNHGRIDFGGSTLPLRWVIGFAIVLIAAALALPRRSEKPPR